MNDVVSPETRSRMMSGIRGKDTKPEHVVRKALYAAGFRFRLHRRDLPGIPDVVLPGRKVVVFVHGCFWHLHKGCRYAKIPKTRPDFWGAKLGRNVVRDGEHKMALLAAGWRVMVVWECATRDGKMREALPRLFLEWISGHEKSGEISPNF